ncbi:hypothetical protein [Pseudorhodoplanes sinuspersici]|uniref:Uncharacterized protein n=1 Tax=Pseudorhodoplanes sinuspersici TaxID=1235591 RepID=A0A1W6ZLG1_9HYPH|nr:hypothetical protein [Pseudorhodoplanes sinuspersici]ARP98105.1 hypothetical protein CAK95_02660 [Pseudorhodoplanes sinuspersici]RKE68143.1 hypothetical protein DFP91_4507 [Pseudorhodoplanes sinuspersici]
MDNGFIDLDILLTRVRQPQSKIYFLDAVKAYKAGALRAALSSAWVAVVYDLIAKYRELGAMEDGAAIAFIQSWDAANAAGDIKRLLDLEARIIDDATTNTQIINRLAATHLDRLRQDRHLCAHPAFSAEAELFEPTPELVRLHLVNAIDLVLSQEPRQGKAIFEQFDADVQSTGFPNTEIRILDYVEQRYLARVRPQNVRNFGTVLAKSLLKGVPPRWEIQRRKIVSSLVAIRDRAPNSWPDLSQTIARLIDSIEPDNRQRAIAFIAAFPDFWPLLEAPTRTALQETAENIDATDIEDYRMLAAVTLPQFRNALLELIDELSGEQLRAAIAADPIPDLWPKAIGMYEESGSWRGSEANFRNVIAPFSGRLSSDQHDELLDAIVNNGQNWDAADTPSLSLGLLKNANAADYPTHDARNRFYLHLYRTRHIDRYEDVLALLQTDGWTLPPDPQDDDE